jgi:hypothetical protein
VAQEVGARLGECEILLTEVQGRLMTMAPSNLQAGAPESIAGAPERILYIPFDHLNSDRGVLKTANTQTDIIVFVESARMTSGRPWHPERLFFIICPPRGRGFHGSLHQGPDHYRWAQLHPSGSWPVANLVRRAIFIRAVCSAQGLWGQLCAERFLLDLAARL